MALSAPASPRAKRNGLSVRGHAEAVPGQAAPRRWAHPTVPTVLLGRWFPALPAGRLGLSQPSADLGDCGRVDGLIAADLGSYSANDRAGPLDREPGMPDMRKDRNHQAFSSKRAFHEGDQDVRVDLVPIGFKVVLTEFGCSFYCDTCGTSADHK